MAGINYEVDPDLAGETVILWWGIFDNELYVEHGDKRFVPTRQWADQSLCIATARLRNLPLNNVRTESRHLPNNWPYLGPHWKAILVQLCLSVTGVSPTKVRKVPQDSCQSAGP